MEREETFKVSGEDLLKKIKEIINEGNIRKIIIIPHVEQWQTKVTPPLLLTRTVLCRAFSRTCKEIYPDWKPDTLTIASSSNKKKMSLHISTFGLHLKILLKLQYLLSLSIKNFQYVYKAKILLTILQIKNHSPCKCLTPRR